LVPLIFKVISIQPTAVLKLMAFTFAEFVGAALVVNTADCNVTLLVLVRAGRGRPMAERKLVALEGCNRFVPPKLVKTG
jgi:hypothetical protein